MTLSKRERVIRTLEIGEPDMIPIHNMGFEHTAKIFQEFLESEERKQYSASVINKFSKVKYYVTEQRFWNVDILEMDPFGSKLKNRLIQAPPEYPNCRIDPITGKISKIMQQTNTKFDYSYYITGIFKTPEVLHAYWDKYGKPSEKINNRVNYSPQIWEGFVEAISPYFYPMVLLPISMVSDLTEGLTIGRVAYYIRKNPQFIHEIMAEYTKTNLEIIRRLSEAGVDIIFLGDDLGYKGRSMYSLQNYREFFLPYHKQIYQACKKADMFIIHHSDGYIDELLPDMVDAGIDCIQALEPTAGVDLKHLKQILGDRVCFMGGMDHAVLGFGTPKDVEEEVKRCIKAAAQGGGYFAGPGHTILNAPWENILAFRAAIEKYRKYPLIV